jgi:hypothetical protein
MKEKIETLLNEVESAGALREFLQQSDFYRAPCSTKFHLCCDGGLAKHTVNVAECALFLNEKYDMLYGRQSVIVAAICHDLCKVNFYQLSDEKPTDAQMNYLRSLMLKVNLAIPAKLNKAYTTVLIDYMINDFKKNKPMPEYFQGYKIEDALPLGHGEKSLYLAQRLITLTKDEALAIRWHMGAWDLPENIYAYSEAVKQSKLVSILQIADMEATHLLEV